MREGISSWEKPVFYEISSNENIAVLNRSIQQGDEDFFLLVPERDGRIVIETTNRVDTFMEIYDVFERTGKISDVLDICAPCEQSLSFGLIFRYT